MSGRTRKLVLPSLTLKKGVIMESFTLATEDNNYRLEWLKNKIQHNTEKGVPTYYFGIKKDYKELCSYCQLHNVAAPKFLDANNCTAFPNKDSKFSIFTNTFYPRNEDIPSALLSRCRNATWYVATGEPEFLWKQKFEK